MRYASTVCIGFSGISLLGAVAAAAQTPATNLSWCKLVAGGELECVYPSFAECEKWRQSSTGQCVPNPRLSQPRR